MSVYMQKEYGFIILAQYSAGSWIFQDEHDNSLSIKRKTILAPEEWGYVYIGEFE